MVDTDVGGNERGGEGGEGKFRTHLFVSIWGEGEESP